MDNRKAVYLDDAIKAIMTKPAWHNSEGSWYNDADIRQALEAAAARTFGTSVKDCRNCGYGGYNDHYCTYFCYCADECKDWDKWKPSSQPEERLKRISDLVEGSIDHFDRDDAMDLLYQIKAVLK